MGGVLQKGIDVIDLYGPSVLTFHSLRHSSEGLQLPPASFSGAGTRHSVTFAGLTQSLWYSLENDNKTNLKLFVTK